MKNTIRLLAVMLYCLNLTGQVPEEASLQLNTLNEKIKTLSSILKNKNEEFSKENQLRNSISMIGGYSENGYGVMTNFQYYPDKNIDRHFEIGGYVGFMEERETEYNIPVELYSLNIGYFIGIPFLSSKNDAFRLSIGAGGTIGNEPIDVSEIQLDTLESISTKNGAVYGIYGAIESDIKLFKHLSGIVRYTHFHHPKSEIGKTKFLIGLGLNFKF